MPDDLESEILGSDDDLSADVDTDVSSTADDGLDAATIGKWVLGGAGALLAAYLLFQVLSILVGVVGFLVRWGVIFLIAYLVYRGIAWALSDDSSSAGLDEQQIPESAERETEALLEEDQLSVGGGEEVTIDEDEISIDESELSTSDLEDSDLEEEFAQLEREMQND